jgi:hypothetical protein
MPAVRHARGSGQEPICSNICVGSLPSCRAISPVSQYSRQQVIAASLDVHVLAVRRVHEVEVDPFDSSSHRHQPRPTYR